VGGGGGGGLLAMADCYPVLETVRGICLALGGSRLECSRLAEEAAASGIHCVLPIGRAHIAGHPVLGKGWAGVVLAVLHERGAAAAKLLHPRGRRRSLLAEAAAHTAAALLGVAPQLYASTPRVLVSQLVQGPPLGGYTPENRLEAAVVATRLLAKARRLDLAGLRHNELARPEEQVLVDAETLEPYIVDYESATWGQPAGNLTQLVGGLPRTPLGRLCRVDRMLRELRPLLRRYKTGDQAAYTLIRERLLKACLAAEEEAPRA
jgi:predicted Ser/Thr protein kinase